MYVPEAPGREDDAASRAGAAAVRVLAIVAAALVIAILAGTIAGLASGSRQRKLSSEIASAAVAAEARGRAAFTGIGTIRARSADPDPAVVIATVAFPYDASDLAFSEEIGKKAPVLRAAALAVLESRGADDLGPAFESGIKAAMRDAFNARLSLGRVDEVWLSDFALVR